MPTTETRLARARRVADLLDSSVALPLVRYRVGLDALVGLLPGVGDWATTMAALYVVWQAVRLGVPRLTLLRMLGNVAVDAAVGAVPLVGDLLDAGWKANEKNVALLERHVETASV